MLAGFYMSEVELIFNYAHTACFVQLTAKTLKSLKNNFTYNNWKAKAANHEKLEPWNVQFWMKNSSIYIKIAPNQLSVVDKIINKSFKLFYKIGKNLFNCKITSS